MFLRIKNNTIQYPYTSNMLRLDYPNTSFPKHITDELYEKYNIFRVYPTPKPIVEWNEGLTEDTPIYINQRWEQRWRVYQLSQTELDYKIGIEWDSVRERRALLLSESDWTQLNDIDEDIRNKWIIYRDQLRRIPQDFSNPFDVIWPTKPT